MSNTNDMNDIASKSLGSSASYAVYTDKFDPSLLNPMPRSIARDHWGITGNEFVGWDVWHCHEATFLTDSGCPVAGTLKFVYSSSSPFMVESKSAKLYLNSFDMCKMGVTLSDAIEAYEAQIAMDLSACVGTEVKVKFYSSNEYAFADKVDLLENAGDISRIVPDLDTEAFTDYSGEKHHVSASKGASVRAIYTNALRSRCRHTKQKDTGLALIDHASTTCTLDPLSVFKQIVSLREVNEFHEFCAEKLFVEIDTVMNSHDNLAIALLYSRRGSLDINPVRASKGRMLSHEIQSLIDVNILTMKVQGQ